MHLEAVSSHPETHGDVRRLTESILDSLHRHRARTGHSGETQAHTHRGGVYTPRQPHKQVIQDQLSEREQKKKKGKQQTSFGKW